MTSNLTPRAVLESNFLFRGLPDATLDRLAALARRRTVAKGQIVFSQGDDGDALYGVVAGRVEISASDGEGDQISLNIMEPGDSFGEIALIDGKPRTASAIAMETSDLLYVERNHFEQLMRDDPELPIHMLQLFCERVRWTSDLIEEAAFLNVPERLAKRLLHLARREGSGDPVAALSQTQLAQFLSVTRQIVNLYLREWQAEGWIALKRGKITIRDAGALRALAAHEDSALTSSVSTTPDGSSNA